MYHRFLIHSSADGHLGCFHVLAVINSAVMNIGVYVSLSITLYAHIPSLSTHTFIFHIHTFTFHTPLICTHFHFLQTHSLSTHTFHTNALTKSLIPNQHRHKLSKHTHRYSTHTHSSCTHIHFQDTTQTFTF